MPSYTPLDAAHALFEALARKNWSAAAALVDPESLGEWRELQVALLADEAEDLSRPEPPGATMRQVLVDTEIVGARLRAYGGTVLPNLGFNLTLSELAALPASDLLARYLELIARFREVSAERPVPDVIGAVLENDSTAHVLYRWEGLAWPQTPREVSVLSLRKGSTGWRYLVDKYPHGPTLADLARGI